MESASESASLDLSNISVAADQGISRGFRNSMIKIKHKNIKGGHIGVSERIPSVFIALDLFYFSEVMTTHIAFPE